MHASMLPVETMHFFFFALAASNFILSTRVRRDGMPQLEAAAANAASA